MQRTSGSLLLHWGVFSMDMLHCNKINVTVIFAFKPPFAGADGIHTWFSDIGECFADWSQTKHILGLHFEVVPAWKTNHKGLNERFSSSVLLQLGEGEENVNGCSRWAGTIQSGWFKSRLFHVCTNPEWVKHNEMSVWLWRGWWVEKYTSEE